jgi:hypothetical protein
MPKDLHLHVARICNLFPADPLITHETAIVNHIAGYCHQQYSRTVMKGRSNQKTNKFVIIPKFDK